MFFFAFLHFNDVTFYLCLIEIQFFLSAANCINNLTVRLPHGYSNQPGNLVASDCIKSAKSGNHKITAFKVNPGDTAW